MIEVNNINVAVEHSLGASGLDEKWLQQRIWDEPTILGLGELIPVSKEKVVSSGGFLDLLFKTADGDAMYEVEVMLGETDPSHIIRTIEYWDLIRRKWPQRRHYGVLVAETITRRYFNVVNMMFYAKK